MTAMHWGADTKNRVKQLMDQITIETDPEKCSALIKELNELLDGVQPVREPKQGA